MVKAKRRVKQSIIDPVVVVRKTILKFVLRYFPEDHPLPAVGVMTLRSTSIERHATTTRHNPARVIAHPSIEKFINFPIA